MVVIAATRLCPHGGLYGPAMSNLSNKLGAPVGSGRTLDQELLAYVLVDFRKPIKHHVGLVFGLFSRKLV